MALSRVAHDRVIVSGRFRIARATEVQAASSATSRPFGAGAWPVGDEPSARPAGRRGTRARCFSQERGRGFAPPPARGARAEGPRVGPAQPVFEGRPALPQDPRGEDARRLDVGRVVQQHERLLRDVGAGPLGARTPRGWARRRRAGSAAGTSAATRCRAPRRYWSSPCVGVPLARREVQVRPVARRAGTAGRSGRRSCADEQAADGQGVVAHELGVEPEARLAGESAVVRDRAPGARARSARGLAVGGRGDEGPHHVLHVPAALHELDGQPVEQLGVGRPLALRAEVVEGAGEALAEEASRAGSRRRGRSAGCRARSASGPGRAGWPGGLRCRAGAGSGGRRASRPRRTRPASCRAAGCAPARAPASS